MREKILELGWRRHSVIQPNSELGEKIQSELEDEHLELLKQENSLLIIVTYDCAVVHGSFEQEPWLQVLIAVPTIIDKSKLNGRNSRFLHFSINTNSSELVYEVSAVSFCQIRRQNISEFKACTEFELSEESSNQLNTWVSERFRQETWPEAFNALFDAKAKKKLKAFYKRYNDYVSTLYLHLNSYEELEPSDYQVAIIIAVDEGKKRSLIKVLQQREPKKKISIDESLKIIANEIKVIFDEVVTIIPDESNELKLAIEVLSEDEISIAQKKKFYKFSPHSLSEPEHHPIPLELIAESRH